MSRSFSEEEARQILALAAERDHVARTYTEDRLTLEELEEAAQAAGIDPVHVRSAVADVLRPGRRSVYRTYLGVPVEVRQTREFPADLSEHEWASVVEACRQVFGRPGVVTKMGHTREWASRSDERDTAVRLVAEPTEGGTRVTVERKTWPRALGAALGTTMNVAVGLVLLVAWLGTGASGGLWLPALVLMAFSVAFGIGAFVKLRKDGRREAEAFEEVLGRLGHVIGALQPTALHHPEGKVLPTASQEASVLLPASDQDAPGLQESKQGRKLRE